MKKLKKTLAALLCLVMILAPVQIFAETTEAPAVKQEVRLNKNNGRYYYYENGKRVTKRNVWVKIKSGASKGVYYFQKNGTACAAEKLPGMNYNIRNQKIGKYYYGFDNKGRRVTGLWYKADGTAYYFNSNGTCNSTVSRKYRALSPRMNPVMEQKSVSNARKLLDKLGRPRAIKSNGDSCVLESGLGTDYIAVYAHYELQYTKYNKTGKTFVTGIWPR